jgi:hypothetical protein
MCQSNAFSAKNTPKHWLEFEKRLEDIPPGHRRAIADALRALGTDIFELDFHRAQGLLDASELVRRAK